MRQDVDTAPTGTATLEAPAPQIAPLKDLADFRVASGDPDVRGWKVIGSDGQTLGEVNDLLVDTAALRVRYLDMKLDRDLLASSPSVASMVGAYAAPGMAGAGPVLDPGDGHAPSHHVLVPIGLARLDEDHDRLYLDGLDSNDVAVLPVYDHRAVLNRDYETQLLRRFDRRHAPSADRDFYAGELYDEERFYGPRRKRRRLL